MKTKHTLISEKELHLLESLIASYGNIINFNQFFNEVKDSLSRQEALNLVMKLRQNGWLISVKKGLYFITSLSSHGFANISPLLIANILRPESYISFDAALNYHNLFNQMIKTYISVTPQRPRSYHFQDLNYRYVKIKEALYFGFKEIEIEGLKSKIAELEKVFLDYLYYRNDSYSMDIFWEKINLGKDQINFKKMIKMSMKFPLTTKRKLGFFLDKLGKNTQKLADSVHKNGYSWLTKNSKNFNNKWRLYYEDRFDHSLTA